MKQNKSHGCLYYLFIFPLLAPFYFLKWMFSLFGNIMIWVMILAVIIIIAGASLYVLIPLGIILIIYYAIKSPKYKNAPNYDNMNGAEFEKFCCHLLSKNGFKDVKVTKASGDQGIDILAKNGGSKLGIQCKCYSSNVGNSAVQEVYSGIKYYGCDQGIVITNQYFTASAIELAKSTNIWLWDRNKLNDLIKTAYKTKAEAVPGHSNDSSETIESINQKISNELTHMGNVYADTIKQFRYSDVKLVEARDLDDGYEFVYDAESPEQVDYIITLEAELNRNLKGVYSFRKLYGTRFLLRTINENFVSPDILQNPDIHESKIISTKIDFKSYEDSDIEKYQFLATLDDRTCPICGKLDGKIFYVKDRKIGINCPPMHDGCRCTTAAVIDGYSADTRRARNLLTGKSEIIPYITYSEWIEQYKLPNHDD